MWNLQICSRVEDPGREVLMKFIKYCPDTILFNRVSFRQLRNENHWRSRTCWQLSVQAQVMLIGCFSSPTQTCGQPHLDSHVAGNGDITSGACQSHLTAIKEAEGTQRSQPAMELICISLWSTEDKNMSSIDIFMVTDHFKKIIYAFLCRNQTAKQIARSLQGYYYAILP